MLHIKLNKYYLDNVVKKTIKSMTVDNFIFTYIVCDGYILYLVQRRTDERQ